MDKKEKNTQICQTLSEKILDEKELLDNYRKLDRRGQHRAHLTIYEELDRTLLSKDIKNVYNPGDHN